MSAARLQAESPTVEQSMAVVTPAVPPDFVASLEMVATQAVLDYLRATNAPDTIRNLFGTISMFAAWSRFGIKTDEDNQELVRHTLSALGALESLGSWDTEMGFRAKKS
jgi:hypothetical protein